MQNYTISDESNDKAYFTIIPNYIVNHSTAIDQALYLQMKKHAGENGLCFVSEKNLMKKMGIGKKALKKSINYLLTHGWIKKQGISKVDTSGGKQKIQSYSVVDIWKLNSDFYNKRGTQKNTPLRQGYAESTPKGVSKVTKGVRSGDTKKNPEEDINNNIREALNKTRQSLRERGWNL